MTGRQVSVRIDDRARLLSAVLALTTYPDQAQQRKRHGTHPHSRGTVRTLSDYADHLAVKEMQSLLDEGIPLAAMYSEILRLPFPALTYTNEPPRWMPAGWSDHLRDFYAVANLASWWQREDEPWQSAARQLQDAFAKVDLYKFLEPFIGSVDDQLVFMPNLSYPTNQNIGFRVGDELITIMPPPLAWGDSAPWAYKDEPALAYRAALGEYTELLFSAYMRANAEIINRLAEHPLPVDEKYAMDHPTWQDQFLGLTKAVLIALFLEQSVSPLEAKSYVQYMQRIEHLSMLPGAMGIFKRYLDEYHAGQIGSFSEYLPNISKYLRVTKSIGAL